MFSWVSWAAIFASRSKSSSRRYLPSSVRPTSPYGSGSESGAPSSWQKRCMIGYSRWHLEQYFMAVYLLRLVLASSQRSATPPFRRSGADFGAPSNAAPGSGLRSLLEPGLQVQIPHEPVQIGRLNAEQARSFDVIASRLRDGFAEKLLFSRQHRLVIFPQRDVRGRLRFERRFGQILRHNAVG